MRSDSVDPKEQFKSLRKLSWPELWEREVPRFNQADSAQRGKDLALIRAVGTVFAEAGRPSDGEAVRQWLVTLLGDGNEKIRRYALNALPKVGAGAVEERAVLGMLSQVKSEPERKAITEALEKFGREETLRRVESDSAGMSSFAEQKIRANVIRDERAGELRSESILREFADLRIHLRGRRGLEEMVREEVEDPASGGKFRVIDVRSGFVALKPIAPFSLADLYRFRCCGTMGFALGVANVDDAKAFASMIASPAAQRVMMTFTAGTPRYRLEFLGQGHRRAVVRQIAELAFEQAPGVLNDSRQANWAVEIYPMRGGGSLELRPRLSPDPRFYYRCDDVPAASHPPLAACLARWSRQREQHTVWDPFCGSGSELIERALLGGVRRIIGTDLSPEAVAIAGENIRAAGLGKVAATLRVSDFRDYAEVEELRPGGVDLVISNPPLGRRVPIPDLRELIDDLFRVAAVVLRPGGWLVFVNPVSGARARATPFTLKVQQVVDLGGFECSLEVYQRR